MSLIRLLKQSPMGTLEISHEDFEKSQVKIAEKYGSEPVPDRKIAIDQAKAIGIVSVVYGHSLHADSATLWAIYSFHMPLFFLLSGLLWRESKLTATWQQTTSQLRQTIIVPYVFFAAASVSIVVLHSFLRKINVTHSSSLIDLIGIVLYGAGKQLSRVNGVLWFFTALAVTVFCYYLVRRLFGRWAAVLLSLVGCLIVVSIRRHSEIGLAFVERFDVLPWNLDVASCCLTFYSLGAALSSTPFDQWIRRRPIGTLGIGIGLLVAGIMLGFQNIQRNDLRSFVIGKEWIFFPSAIFGSMGVILLCGSLPMNPVSRYLSRNSIGIFPVHLFLLPFATRMVNGGISQWIPLPGELVSLLLTTPISILGCVPVVWVIRRFFPFALGHRP